MTEMSDIVSITIRHNRAALVESIKAGNVLVDRLMANRPKPQPLTIAQRFSRLANRVSDAFRVLRGEAYVIWNDEDEL